MTVEQTITDSFGGSWQRCGFDCDLQVVRPGKVQCNGTDVACPQDKLSLVEELGEDIAKLLTTAPFPGPRARAKAKAVLELVQPKIEELRKAVEDAPKVAKWLGICVECGDPIEHGDQITWRLRWSPQGPVHKECR